MRKHHSALGGVALALALTLTGCSDDGTDPEAEDTPTATPPTPTSASPTPKTPEEKAAAQLTKYLDVRDDALRAGTIDFKRLNKVATGRGVPERSAERRQRIERSGSKVTGEYVHTLGEPRDRGGIDPDHRLRGPHRASSGRRTGKPVTRTHGPGRQPAAQPCRRSSTRSSRRRAAGWSPTPNVLWDEPC